MIFELEATAVEPTHLLREMSTRPGGRHATVKCGAELPVLRPGEGGAWTVWTSQVTCRACLEAMG